MVDRKTFSNIFSKHHKPCIFEKYSQFREQRLSFGEMCLFWDLFVPTNRGLLLLLLLRLFPPKIGSSLYYFFLQIRIRGGFKNRKDARLLGRWLSDG